MPDHARKQIRDAAKALLLGLTMTGSRVEVGRTFALTAAHDPTLLIYTKDEKSGTGGQGAARSAAGPVMGRALELVVQGRVSHNAPPDDLLDAIAAEVETKIGANQKFSGLIVAMELAATKTETIAQGERHLGLVQMEFTVIYRTAEGAPAVSL
jgi:hypothetical protein